MNKERNLDTCDDCGHTKGQCNCLCCCSLLKIGCPTCMVPVLAYRGFKRLIRKTKKLSENAMS